ncbi:MAG TPA: metallophosphoesterase [Methanosarcina sp.]|nr:metallophosphoesterase [Methanosarcina sp.]
MKIQVVSDLHLEFRSNMKTLKWWKGGVDVVVIAGDACNAILPYTLSKHLRPILESGTKVVYVPGNHETYHANSVEHYQDKMKEAFANRESEGLYLLDNSTADIPDPSGGLIRFIGSTLWSDLSNPMDALVVRGWPDFAVPGHDTSRHTALHKQAVAFIEDSLWQAYDDKVTPVVVTHFCPSRRSVHEKYEGDPANPYFATELSVFLEDWAPRLWIHGHTHTPFDYQHYNTRVVCNPYGYPHEHDSQGTYFDQQKIVEINDEFRSAN